MKFSNMRHLDKSSLSEIFILLLLPKGSPGKKFLVQMNSVRTVPKLFAKKSVFFQSAKLSCSNIFKSENLVLQNVRRNLDIDISLTERGNASVVSDSKVL